MFTSLLLLFILVMVVDYVIYTKLVEKSLNPKETIESVKSIWFFKGFQLLLFDD